MRALLAAIALACLVGSAMAADLCKSVDEAKKLVSDSGGQWIELSEPQWQFMRGIYAMDPQTGAGLPPGERAVLGRNKDGEKGVILFLDGERACWPIVAPKELLEMLNQIGDGTIRHADEGSL